MSNPFLIRKITLRLCDVELKRVNYYSSGEKDPEIKAILVEIEADGQSGWGEWIPTSIIYKPGHIGRSSLEEWEVAQTTAQSLLGQDARNTRTWLSPDLRQEDANSLVDGFDFAMHDLIGKKIGWSVQKLLGNGAPWIWGMPLLYRESPEVSVERARELYQEGGYLWYKLKPSCNLDQDMATMRLIREQIDPEIQFYIDPNYTLPKDTDFILQYLNTLHQYGLRVCEDPINAELSYYRELQERTPVEIMIDEKARSLGNVRKIGEAQCTRRINVHANWAGGFIQGMQRAQLAAAYNMQSIVGSSRFLGIATAAYQTLASLLPNSHLSPCEQVNDTAHVKHTVVKQRFQTRDGKIFIPDAPGLGIDIDHTVLDSVTCQKIVIE